MVEIAMAHLADAMMLPFVMIVDGDGNYLAGSHGAVRPDRFEETLREVASPEG